MKVDNHINSKNANWSFGGDVPKNFVPHIRKSVPGYERGHEITCQISEFFCLKNSVCYDLGTSTGELIKKLAQQNASTENIKWVGIDCVPEMIKVAKDHCKDTKNIEILEDDIGTFDYEPADFITSYYVMQFVPPRRRQEIFAKIYNSLNWGGAFVMFEKVRAPDARFQDIATQIYTEFKLENQFEPNEIVNKSKSLKSILEPFSTEGNLTLLRNAGFNDIMTVFKDVCFEGFLAIK